MRSSVKFVIHAEIPWADIVIADAADVEMAVAGVWPSTIGDYSCVELYRIVFT
jgi:hypothetical protein